MKEQQIENNEIQTHTEHSWPHIPSIQWEQLVYWINTTVITTILFGIIVLIVSFFWNKALKSKKKSRFKTALLTYFKFADDYLRDSFWDKSVARKYFPLVVWIFSIIFFWNIFWLAIDWLISAFPNAWIEKYLRPMHSDLNTTLVLATITVVTFLWVAVKTHWAFKTTKWYLFNFTWKTIAEKFINVFVGWLHLIGIPATLMSLSLRLFGNIFAWIILIGVITYLWQLMSENFFQVWRLLTVPFWFFEFFVALIQAIVFAALIISYVKQAKEEH